MNDIKKMTALTIALGCTTSLLLIALIRGYDFTFMKILAVAHVLIFLISCINLMRLKIKDEIDDE